MKRGKTITFLVCLTLFTMQASSQATTPLFNEPIYSKPKLFADLPDKLPLQISDLERLLHLPVGAQVSVQMAKGFPLIGRVVSTSDGSDSLVKSVVISSHSRQGATLTFTRITDKDGSVSFIGRMLNKKNGDALEIVKEGNQYLLQKKGLYDLINE